MPNDNDETFLNGTWFDGTLIESWVSAGQDFVGGKVDQAKDYVGEQIDERTERAKKSFLEGVGDFFKKNGGYVLGPLLGWMLGKSWLSKLFLIPALTFGINFALKAMFKNDFDEAKGEAFNPKPEPDSKIKKDHANAATQKPKIDPELQKLIDKGIAEQKQHERMATGADLRLEEPVPTAE